MIKSNKNFNKLKESIPFPLYATATARARTPYNRTVTRVNETFANFLDSIFSDSNTELQKLNLGGGKKSLADHKGGKLPLSGNPLTLTGKFTEEKTLRETTVFSRNVRKPLKLALDSRSSDSEN